MILLPMRPWKKLGDGVPPGVEEVLLEVPGEAVEDGETPAEAAARESLEETGYVGGLVSAGSMIDCAYSTRVRRVFAAHDARKTADPDPGAGEATEVELVPLGGLTDVGPEYLALDTLGLL